MEEIGIKIIQAIQQQGGKAFIVGGYVRDSLLGLDSHDYDIEVYHLTSQELYDVLAQFGKVISNHKFGVYQLAKYPHYDFALARTEKKTGNKHNDFEVEYIYHEDYKKDGQRRDITINSLLMDPLTGDIIDCFGGREDLENRIIRMVNPDTFKEDPLRVLRIARLLSKLEDFEVEEKTMLACKEMGGQVETLSNQRIFDEYSKILMSNIPSRGFCFLRDAGALPPILMDLTATIQRADFHPEGCVFNHVMLVVDLASLCKNETSNPLAFMFSALLHDVGKAIVTTTKGSAPNHDMIGEVMAYDYMYELSNQKDLAKYVAIMTRTHMILMVKARKHTIDVTYLRVLKRIENIFPVDDLILMGKCDKLGRHYIADHTIEEIDTYIEDMAALYGKEAQKPKVTGDDLIALGYQPGPMFKYILDESYFYQLHDKS